MTAPAPAFAPTSWVHDLAVGDTVVEIRYNAIGTNPVAVEQKIVKISKTRITIEDNFNRGFHAVLLLSKSGLTRDHQERQSVRPNSYAYPTALISPKHEDFEAITRVQRVRTARNRLDQWMKDINARGDVSGLVAGMQKHVDRIEDAEAQLRDGDKDKTQQLLAGV